MADEYDYLFKCIVVGDGGVGKTALTIRFSKGFFTEDYKMTIGVDFHVKTISIDTEEEGPIKVKLQIWDTGGQERFSSIRPMYYRGSLGGLLIFDLTSYESFEHLPQWIEEVRANIKTEIPLLLVGNKSDLINEHALSNEEINSFTQKFNLYYMETSAKTGDGVGDCFYILACLMVGSGVPDQLISQGIVYTPGQAITAPSITPTEAIPEIKPEVNIITPSLEPKPETEFIAPPVPEPAKIFEPEPEIDFAAPPVPEPAKIFGPEPEIDFAAPPVPEPTSIKELEPVEFEFKTPEQILSEEVQKEEPEAPFTMSSKISVSSETPVYKPKAVPFTSNIPVPAPAPEEFKTSEPKSESLVDYMPETILSKKEKKKLEKQRKKEEKEKLIQEKREKAAKLKEEMQKVGKEEKEKAKLEKQKKKEERERKLQEKKEKAAKLKEEMQKVGKKEKIPGIETETQPFMPFQASPQEKKETIVPFQAAQPEKKESEGPNLFQTLSEKTEQPTTSESASFIPFSATESSDKQEPSSLRIIPNVADIEKDSSQAPLPEFFDTSSQPTIPEIPTFQREVPSTRKKDVIICPYCGAMLSSDYAFCNKCGAKLQ